MLGKFNGNFVFPDKKVTNFVLLNFIFHLIFPFEFCLYKALRRATCVHGLRMVLHTLLALLKSAWTPRCIILMFSAALFFFLFCWALLVTWIAISLKVIKRLFIIRMLCVGTGDPGHLSPWGSKTSEVMVLIGERPCAHQQLKLASANPAFLVASFFNISRDLLSTSWLLFKYKLWSAELQLKHCYLSIFSPSFPSFRTQRAAKSWCFLLDAEGGNSFSPAFHARPRLWHLATLGMGFSGVQCLSLRLFSVSEEGPRW